MNSSRIRIRMVKEMSDDYDWIDLHHHIIPDFYVNSLAELGITELSGVPIPKLNPGKSLSDMDKLGIDKAIISTPFAGLPPSDPGCYSRIKSSPENWSERPTSISRR